MRLPSRGSLRNSGWFAANPYARLHGYGHRALVTRLPRSNDNQVRLVTRGCDGRIFVIVEFPPAVVNRISSRAIADARYSPPATNNRGRQQPADMLQGCAQAGGCMQNIRRHYQIEPVASNPWRRDLFDVQNSIAHKGKISESFLAFETRSGETSVNRYSVDSAGRLGG